MTGGGAGEVQGSVAVLRECTAPRGAEGGGAAPVLAVAGELRRLRGDHFG